jgi:branched-chain amino acid transport system substrate-binding protein
MMLKRFAQTTLAISLLASAAAAGAQELKIALITSKTSPVLEAYAKQTETGFMMGLEYLTNGTMTVGGRKIKVIVKDDQGKPDLAKTLLAEAYADDKVDLAVGPTGSGAGIAMAPIAAEFKKVLIVEAAVAADITGKFYNRYVFKTSRNSYHDSCASAATTMAPVSVAVLAQDNAFGRDGVEAGKECLKKMGSKATIVHEEYAPATTTDFTASAQRIFDALKDKPAPRFLQIAWAGANPINKIAALKPERFGITLLPGGNILPVMKTWSAYAGAEGSLYYYYDFPKNKMNEWFVAEYKKRNNGTPPDFFHAGGVAAASAVITALKKTNGSTDSEKLIAAMEGMDFDTPKGKMTFRKEDHQALQEMYHFRIKEASKQKNEWDILELVRVIPAAEMPIPIKNK